MIKEKVMHYIINTFKLTRIENDNLRVESVYQVPQDMYDEDELLTRESANEIIQAVYNFEGITVPELNDRIAAFDFMNYLYSYEVSASFELCTNVKYSCITPENRSDNVKLKLLRTELIDLAEEREEMKKHRMFESELSIEKELHE